jgi:hypothetical protein
MSVKTQAEKNLDMMIKNLDAYPVSNEQVTGIVTDYRNESFMFDDAVPATCDKIIKAIELGVPADNIWVRPRNFAYINRIEHRLVGHKINMLLPNNPMPQIPLIPITNPAVSKRNPNGQGRVTIYPEITRIADKFRQGSNLPGCCNLIEGWWSGKDINGFRAWLLPQVYKIEFTPGKHYDVLDRLWAVFYKPGYNGPVHVVNKDEDYEYYYDFAKHGVIIDTGSAEGNDLLFKTQTKKKYDYYRGAFGSIVSIKKLTKKSTVSETVEIVAGLKYKNENGFLNEPTYETFVTTIDVVDTLRQSSTSWRLVKGYYGPDSSDPIEKVNPHAWKRHRFVLVPPGPYLPNSFVAINFASKADALKHKAHLESDLVNFQVESTRRGKSISTEQTNYIGHLDEMSPLSAVQTQILKLYTRKYLIND